MCSEWAWMDHQEHKVVVCVMFICLRSSILALSRYANNLERLTHTLLFSSGTVTKLY